MKRKIFCLSLAFALLLPAAANACTLWAAQGSAVNGGGSMIVKNRDWLPNQYQHLKLIKPKKGYAYFSLYAEGTPAGTKAGINEHGLVAVIATAGSIPAGERAKIEGVPSLTRVLSECASVEEALSRTDLLVGPKILMLADRKRVAAVEIGPGSFSVRVVENGAIFHTNHYVHDDMLTFNVKVGLSSRQRYERIGELVGEDDWTFSFSDFLGFSEDRKGGADNGIFRTGSAPGKTRTVAVWAVRLPAEGSPEIYVKLLNPGEEEKVFHYSAEKLFEDY